MSLDVVVPIVTSVMVVLMASMGYCEAVMAVVRLPWLLLFGH